MEPGSSKVVAAFDLDGTLTHGGSVFKWLRHVGGNLATYRSALWRLWPLAWGALVSGEAADRAKESLFHAILAGRLEIDVRNLSHHFADVHLKDQARPHVLARMKWHLDQGHHVVVVSASPEIYVAVVAENLGAHGAIGTRLAVDPLGRLTGGYLGQNCRGEQKIKRLNEWITERGLSDDVELYAYGNSRGDRRMLAGATHAYDAGKLGALGALRHYERLKASSTP